MFLYFWLTFHTPWEESYPVCCVWMYNNREKTTMPPIPTLNELILLVVMVVVVALPEAMRFLQKPTDPKHNLKKE
jgi:hypothetical protein